jgi:signal peptidase I
VPVVAVALVVVVTLVALAEPVRVSSSSMSPTYRSGNQVVIAKAGGRAHHPHRRDVIAFHVPGSSELLIKRVVGVAGDSVGLSDGVLVVNGQRVHESFVDYNLTDATYFGPVVVPPGTVFVMGDNRSDSIDSRLFGPVPRKDIVGRVVARIWPL